MRPVFIIGSPRSGTTVLGDILDNHPLVGNWFEPYFVLDRFFREAPDDVRSADDATEEVVRYVRGEFEYYANKRRVDVVIDKSPRNCLKVPFLRAIFPEARFVHIIRDGRDVTLSIHKEWQRRHDIVTTGAAPGLRKKLMTVKKMLWDKQPLMRHKLQSLHFEMGSWANLNFSTFQHRIRWKGRVGWGPRFSGYENALASMGELAFNSRQWVESVEAVLAERGNLPDEQYMELRYEDFVQHPLEELRGIFSFIGVEETADFVERLPVMKSTNFGKWRKEFSPEEIEEIRPVLDALLARLSYLERDPWQNTAR